MHICIKLPTGKTKVLHVDRCSTIEDLNQLIPHFDHTLAFTYQGRQLELASTLQACDIHENDTICTHLLVLGGSKLSAADRARLEHEQRERKRISDENYSRWFECADRTQPVTRKDDGVMRLLCVSNTLIEDKYAIHGEGWSGEDPEQFDSKAESPFCSEPRPKTYGDDAHGGTGWAHQGKYDAAYRKLFDAFVRQHWSRMTPDFSSVPPGAADGLPPLWDYPDPSPPPAAAGGAGGEEKKAGPEAAKKALGRAGSMAGGARGSTRKLHAAAGDDLARAAPPGTIKVRVETGPDGLWFNGPRRIVRADAAGGDAAGGDGGGGGKGGAGEKGKEGGGVLWDLEAEVRKGGKEGPYYGLWSDRAGGFKPPWRVAGEYAPLERWLYEGIGTTTYLRFKVDGKQVYVLCSQEDAEPDSPLCLTDRERLRLKQLFQYEVKLTRANAEWTPEEKALLGKIKGEDEDCGRGPFVERGPLYDEEHGILQYRVQPLRKQLERLCVFWTNTEIDLPGGSVAEEAKCPSLSGAKGVTPGRGKEAFEFWKYEEKVGALRKKYVMEDRQRLLDTIETFTPDYYGLIKRAGKPPDDEGRGDHLMSMEHQQIIVNAVALALDMNMPDYPEDKVSCYVKRVLELSIPDSTWHVVVGRSFGFYIQCEARHFIHLYMRHLSIVIWKSEPASD